jgi:hypothetical protein
MWELMIISKFSHWGPFSSTTYLECMGFEISALDAEISRYGWFGDVH